jgi:hypothetical protein
MTLQEQQQIAKTFSDTYAEFGLNLTLTTEEFALFDKGVFAADMDEKWNVFVLDNLMYWARSWTDACIFKIPFSRQADLVTFEKGLVTRNKNQYKSEDIEHDRVFFLKLLQAYLKRDDIYVDPAFEFEMVKQLLDTFLPRSRFISSISRKSVAINKVIYQSVLQIGQWYADDSGWTDFYEKIQHLNDNEPILGLYVQDRETNQGITYHFDKDGKTLISTIVPVSINSR